MSTWYEQAIFYHMYPLGMTGAPDDRSSKDKRADRGDRPV